LAHQPAEDTTDALIRNYEWYLANLEKVERSSGILHRLPWKQGIRRAAKFFF
jgi:uncharacterized NAD(P)/FAD-binding protein YdhS